MDAPFSQGRVLLGKYRVERVIGKGAMGLVLAAKHIDLDDRVAIKLLLPEMLAEEGVVERFLQEARAVRKIKSEHVAQVSDVGRLDDGTPYIIMEYLEGRDLAKIRGDRGRLEVEEVVEYILQALEAIAEAHAHGIVHRDLKPANLFLTRRSDGAPLIKVLDFGTSKMQPREMREDLEMTKTGMAIGSPSYMAPEQMLSSRGTDQRADIWALGVILYNLLTGTFPFKADTLLQMCAAVLQIPPVPPTKYRPELPAELEAAVLRCLGKKPSDRFNDVAELARALMPFGPPNSHIAVERIERVLGVTGDLATFLAPSLRHPELPPASKPASKEDIEVQVALLPPDFEARSERRPDTALITRSLRPSEIGVNELASAPITVRSLTTKSIVTTSLATASIASSSLASVVRSTSSSSNEEAPVKLSSAPRAAKRGRKAIALGAMATLALGAGLLFTFSGPLASEERPEPFVAPAKAEVPSARAARAVEIATPVDMGNEPGWSEPAMQEAVAPFPSAIPSVGPAATIVPASPPINRGSALANASRQINQAGQNGYRGQAQASGQAQSAPPAPPPAPAKKAEPSIVLPDDR